MSPRNQRSESCSCAREKLGNSAVLRLNHLRRCPGALDRIYLRYCGRRPLHRRSQLPPRIHVRPSRTDNKRGELLLPLLDFGYLQRQLNPRSCAGPAVLIPCRSHRGSRRRRRRRHRPDHWRINSFLLHAEAEPTQDAAAGRGHRRRTRGAGV